jgi:ferredoxin
MAIKISAVQLIRRITLGVMLAGMTVLTILHQKLQGIPSIDAMDPFGGLETLLKFAAGGGLIRKIEPGTIVLFAGFVVLSLVLSRFFCGWFCAFGALQGVFGSLGKKLFGRRFTVPVKLDRILRWVKYPVLVGIVFLTWKTGTLIIRPYDPLAAYGHLTAGLDALMTEFTVGFFMLIAIVVSSALFERAFCKYVCPLGALSAILSRIPLFRIRRVPSTCISCAKCDAVCPMNVDVSGAEAIASSECISCMECVTACPVKPASLVISLGGKTLKVGMTVLAGFIIYFGAALVGEALGMFHFAAPSLQSMAERGTLSVADIKGSSTYEMVAESFQIELAHLYREVGIDAEKVSGNTMLKETGAVAGIEEFEVDSVRIAVAKILGVAYEGEEGAAAAVISEEDACGVDDACANIGKTVAGTNLLSVPSDFELEGTMTIAEVASVLGVKSAEVIAKLALPAAIPVDRPLRDMRGEFGYSMPDLKERIRQ